VIYWHYTNGTGIFGALMDGNVSPRSSSLSLLFRDRLRPIVWFSRRPTWEPAATRSLRKYGRDDKFMESLGKIQDGGVTLARAERDALAFAGLYRIGVNIVGSALHKWPEFGKYAGMTERVAGWHERAGLEVGSDPADWAASLYPVPTVLWNRLEWWSGDVPTGASAGIVASGPGVPMEKTVAYWGDKGTWLPVDDAGIDFLWRIERQRRDSGVRPLKARLDEEAAEMESRRRTLRENAEADLERLPLIRSVSEVPSSLPSPLRPHNRSFPAGRTRR
jgi:hypothetical protein